MVGEARAVAVGSLRSATCRVGSPTTLAFPLDFWGFSVMRREKLGRYESLGL